nr:uncharacterized mitochondrial protein AtMg00810-like [Tanacetum cinerariifolium]
MVEKSKLDEDKEGKAVDLSHYRGMIGTLLYLTASRLDLQFAICMCTRYQDRPTEKHIHAVKRFFRYVRGTVNRGLWYPKDSSVALTTFADADHVGCQDTRRSTSEPNQQVNRVHILDFEGLTPNIRKDLAEILRMVYTEDDDHEVFVSHAWRRLFEIRAPLVHEFLLEFFNTCRIGDEMGLDMTGRKSGARLSGGHFIRRLAHHFGLVSDDGLRGLSVVTREVPLIDMGKLVNLNICRNIGDDWAWVASRPERQQVSASGAPEAVEDAPVVDEGAQANPAPMSLRRLVERSTIDQGRFSTWKIGCITRFMDASGLVIDKQEKDKIRTNRTKTRSVEKPDSVKVQSQSRKQKREEIQTQGTNTGKS